MKTPQDAVKGGNPYGLPAPPDKDTYITVKAEEYADVEVGFKLMPKNAGFSMRNDKPYYWLNMCIDGYDIRISCRNEALYHSNSIPLSAADKGILYIGLQIQDLVMGKESQIVHYTITGYQQEVKHAVNAITGYLVYPTV